MDQLAGDSSDQYGSVFNLSIKWEPPLENNLDNKLLLLLFAW